MEESEATKENVKKKGTREEEDRRNLGLQGPAIKLIGIANHWLTRDVTKAGEMPTHSVYQKAHTLTKSEGTEEEVQDERGWAQGGSGEVDTTSDDDETHVVLREIGLSAAPSREKDPQQQVVVSSPMEEGEKIAAGTTVNDEEEWLSLLAAAAHEEASQTKSSIVHHGEASKAEQHETEVPLGPYGRGLVDSIGGLWSAGYVAMTYSLQREIEDLIKSGMTLEQASATVRPGCPREVGEDGSVSLASDLQLVRYPRERSFRERIRKLNRDGDRPNLSLPLGYFFPSLEAICTELGSLAARAAVRVLASTWTDPQMVQQLLAQLHREGNFGHAKMKAEYEYSGIGTGI